MANVAPLPRLPPEILNAIIREVIHPSQQVPALRTVILVRIGRSVRPRRRTRHQGAGGYHVRRRHRLGWTYDCSERLPPPRLPVASADAPVNPARNAFLTSERHTARATYQSLLQVSHSVHDIAQSHMPDFLQLGDGPKIYFRPQEDVIYFDYESFFNLFEYMRQNPNRAQRSVQGFDQIRNLGSYHTVNTQGHWYNEGLRLLHLGNQGTRNSPHGILSGLLNLQLHGYMEIHPAGVALHDANGINQEAAVMREVDTQLGDLRNFPVRATNTVRTGMRTEVQYCYNIINPGPQPNQPQASTLNVIP
jgi:hypothetical protein